MAKKVLTLIFIFTLYLFLFSFSSISVNVNDIRFTGKIDDNDIVYLPLSEICSQFEIRYGFFSDTGIIAINFGDLMISGSVGQKSIIINDKIENLENSPRIIQSEVYLPVQFFVKYLDLDISWQPEDFEQEAYIEKFMYKNTEKGLNIFVIADKTFSRSEYFLTKENNTVIISFPNTYIEESDSYLHYPDEYIEGINIDNQDDNTGSIIIAFRESFDIEVGPVVNPSGLVISVSDIIELEDYPENIILSETEDTREVEKIAEEVPGDKNVDDIQLPDAADLLSEISDISDLSNYSDELYYPDFRDIFMESIDDIIIDQSAIKVDQDSVSESLEGKRIVIDAGHGGDDAGITSFGMYEKDISLAIARKLFQKFHNKNAEPFMTRSTNSNLSHADRTYTGNKERADLFISLHTGASQNPGASGFSIFYYSTAHLAEMKDTLSKAQNIEDEAEADRILVELKRTSIMEESRKYARILSRQMEEKTGFIERMIFGGGFSILRDLNMPAVIIEVNMLTNKEIADLLTEDDIQEKIAEAIANAAERYFVAGDSL
ncbi:MAG: N-acetylmuramoyl-L-alanine amidase [Candidatus Muiribacteriota bacterium]